jgi:hypothetical protein
MKNVKKLLILSSSLLLTIGLASCGQGDTPTSSSVVDESSASSVPTINPSKFTKEKAVPSLLVNTATDFDDYIKLKMSDGTFSTDFAITCTSSDVTIAGHTVTATTPGTYNLVFTANANATVSIRLEIDVRSADGMAIIDFLAPLAETPQNYTIQEINISSAGEVSYANTSYIHNENYIAVFDEDNPGAVDKDGDPDSTILAQLNDGKAYWGNFDSTGKPVFDAGSVSYGNYFITEDLTIDGSSFVSTFDDEGNESLTADASFTKAYLNFGKSALYDKYGYDYGSTQFLGFMQDEEKNNVGLIIACQCINQTTQKAGYVAIDVISAIGTTKVTSLETAITDDSYVPAAITAPEVVTAFDAINTAGNYTTSIGIFPSDDDGNILATADVDDTYAYKQMFGMSEALLVTNNVTSEGIAVSMLNGTLAANADTGKIGITKVAVAGEMALFNNGGKSYGASLSAADLEAGKTALDAGSATVLEKVTDVFTTYSAYTNKAVNADAINNTEWTGTSANTDKNLVAYVGKAGDNNGTTRGNELFEALFNQLPITFGSDPFGTYMTKAVEFTSGDKHALSLYCEYSQIVVNTSTNAVSMSVLLYFPVGADNGYAVATFSVGKIGTTTYDFASLLPTA